MPRDMKRSQEANYQGVPRMTFWFLISRSTCASTHAVQACMTLGPRNLGLHCIINLHAWQRTATTLVMMLLGDLVVVVPMMMAVLLVCNQGNAGNDDRVV